MFLKILESFIQVIPLKEEGYYTDKKLISLCRNYLSILQDRKPKLHLSEKNISIDQEEIEFIKCNRFKKLVDHLYLSQRIANHMMGGQSVATGSFGLKRQFADRGREIKVLPDQNGKAACRERV